MARDGSKKGKAWGSHHHSTTGLVSGWKNWILGFLRQTGGASLDSNGSPSLPSSVTASTRVASSGTTVLVLNRSSNISTFNNNNLGSANNSDDSGEWKKNGNTMMSKTRLLIRRYVQQRRWGPLILAVVSVIFFLYIISMTVSQLARGSNKGSDSSMPEKSGSLSFASSILSSNVKGLSSLSSRLNDESLAPYLKGVLRSSAMLNNMYVDLDGKALTSDRKARKAQNEQIVSSQGLPYTVSLIASCEDEDSVDLLENTLPSWRAVQGVQEIILVNWKSRKERQHAVLKNASINDDRIIQVFVHSMGQEYSYMPPILTRALNLAARVSTGNVLLKVDCDTYLDPRFLEIHPVKIPTDEDRVRVAKILEVMTKSVNRISVPFIMPANGTNATLTDIHGHPVNASYPVPIHLEPSGMFFYGSNWAAAQNEGEQMLRKVILIAREHFFGVYGYDERVTLSGYETSDLQLRLRKELALEYKQLNLSTLRSVQKDGMKKGKTRGVWSPVSVRPEWGLSIEEIPLKVSIQVNAIGKEKSIPWKDVVQRQCCWFVNAREGALFIYSWVSPGDSSKALEDPPSSVNVSVPFSHMDIAVREELEGKGFMEDLKSVDERYGRIALAFERVLHDQLRIPWDVLIQLSFATLVDTLDFLTQVEQGGEARARAVFVQIRSDNIVDAVHDLLVSIAYCSKKQVICLLSWNYYADSENSTDHSGLALGTYQTVLRLRDVFDIRSMNRALGALSTASRSSPNVLADEDQIKTLVIPVNDWKCRSLDACSRWDTAYNNIAEKRVLQVQTTPEGVFKMSLAMDERSKQKATSYATRHELIRLSSFAREPRSKDVADEFVAISYKVMKDLLNRLVVPNDKVRQITLSSSKHVECTAYFLNNLLPIASSVTDPEQDHEKIAATWIASHSLEEGMNPFVFGLEYNGVARVRTRVKEQSAAQVQSDAQPADGIPGSERRLLAYSEYTLHQSEGRQLPLQQQYQHVISATGSTGKNDSGCVGMQCAQSLFGDLYASFMCRSLSGAPRTIAEQSSKVHCPLKLTRLWEMYKLSRQRGYFHFEE